MRASATFKWIGLALLGIAIAAVVAIAASNLASQQIGLASEPITAGKALAPAEPSNGGSNPVHSSPKPNDGPSVPTTPSTEPAEPTAGDESPPVEFGDDHGGHASDDD